MSKIKQTRAVLVAAKKASETSKKPCNVKVRADHLKSSHELFTYEAGELTQYQLMSPLVVGARENEQ